MVLSFWGSITVNVALVYYGLYGNSDNGKLHLLLLYQELWLFTWIQYMLFTNSSRVQNEQDQYCTSVTSTIYGHQLEKFKCRYLGEYHKSHKFWMLKNNTCIRRDMKKKKIQCEYISKETKCRDSKGAIDNERQARQSKCSSDIGWPSIGSKSHMHCRRVNLLLHFFISAKVC